MHYSREIGLLSYIIRNKPLMYIQYNLVTLMLKTYYGILGRKKYAGYLVSKFPFVKTLNEEFLHFP